MSQPFSRRGFLVALGLFTLWELVLGLGLSTDFDLFVYENYSCPLTPTGLREMYAAHRVEYPPLTVAFVSGVGWLASHLPNEGGFFEAVPIFRSPASSRAYKLAFTLVIGALNLATFALLWRVVERQTADEPREDRAARVICFAAALGPVAFVLHSRLDLPLGTLLLLWLLLLLERRHWLLSALVLAVAIDYKVLPLALVPLWLLASLEAEHWRATDWSRLARLCALRFSVLVALTVLMVVPFYLAAGERVFTFVGFHKDRGVEVESIYAAVLAVLGQAGEPVRTVPGSGCWEFEGPLAGPMTRVSPLVVGVPLLLGAVHLAWGLRRAARRNDERAANALIRGHVVLALLVLLAGNKVLSPQFLLWFLPLAPLAPLRGRALRWYLQGVFLLSLTTMLVFPVCMPWILGDILDMPEVPPLGPLALGAVALLLRALVLLDLGGQLVGAVRGAAGGPALAQGS